MKHFIIGVIFISLAGCHPIHEMTNQQVIAEVVICEEAGMKPQLIMNVQGGVSKVVCLISGPIK